MKKFIYPILIFFITYFIVGSIYDEITKDKTPGKAKRIECQKRVTTFEKAFNSDEIIFAQNQVKSQQIDFLSSIEKPIYTSSVLVKYISLKEADAMFRNAFNSYLVKNNLQSNGYIFSYYIYENDKNDPGKKNKKSKKYAGYIVFEVKNIENKTIYKIQIDFMNHKGEDIKQSIDCSVKSFMTYPNL